MNTRTLTGTIGELKVAIKLIALGHFPARPYADNGIDILLENGKTIQVKTATIYGKDSCYRFKFGKRENDADFTVCWCLDSDIGYVIPTNELEPRYTIGIGRGVSKYDKYKDNWALLD